MAEVRPFRALHYVPKHVGDLADVVAPPYDVIDEGQRGQLLNRSPYNVVEVDLPRGDNPYAHAAATFAEWRRAGIVTRDPEPAFWAVAQDYTGPDGRSYTRRGFFARVRVEEYGAGRVRPHERTHPGPKEDRLNLTRATRTNLSPIFALHDDPHREAWAALEPHTQGEPFADVTDEDGTRHRMWRVSDPVAVASVTEALGQAELLIADGHHRYETARVYAHEIGGEGPHRYVLTCLVALQDPGLTIFPTHRLLTDLDEARRQELRAALQRDWEAREVVEGELEPRPNGEIEIGFLDHAERRPQVLRLRNRASVDQVLADRSEAYRHLDTAVLETLILRGALGMTEEDISHLQGLDYARSTQEAKARVLSGDVDAGFFMGPVPVEHVQAIAAAGETMPPKSTYFFPKVLTGLVFHSFDEE